MKMKMLVAQSALACGCRTLRPGRSGGSCRRRRYRKEGGQVKLLSVIGLALLASSAFAFNYDESRVPSYVLEKPLEFLDGRKVTANTWPERRRVLLDQHLFLACIAPVPCWSRGLTTAGSTRGASSWRFGRQARSGSCCAARAFRRSTIRTITTRRRSAGASGTSAGRRSTAFRPRTGPGC